MEVCLTKLSKGEKIKLAPQVSQKESNYMSGDVSKKNGREFTKQTDVVSLNKRTCVPQNDPECVSKTI